MPFPDAPKPLISAHDGSLRTRRRVSPISQRRKPRLREMSRFARGPTLHSLGAEMQAPVQLSRRVAQETLVKVFGDHAERA